MQDQAAVPEAPKKHARVLMIAFVLMIFIGVYALSLCKLVSRTLSARVCTRARASDRYTRDSSYI